MLSTILAPLTFVYSSIRPPTVVILPPTVSMPPAVIFTVGVVVEEMIPVLTVDDAIIFKLSLPNVIVKLLVKEPPLISPRVTVTGAVKLAPVLKAKLSLAEPMTKVFVAVILDNEVVEILKMLDPPMLTVSFVFGIRYTVVAFMVPGVTAML